MSAGRQQNGEPSVCEHLRAAEQAVRQAGLVETYRGQPWTDNCRTWVYFDGVLPIDDLLARGLYDPTVVAVHANLDPRSGTERGLCCELDHDGLMGHLPPAAGSI